MADYLSKLELPRRRKVTYLRHDNIGETRTVNRALNLVRTEFFTILNSDDTILPGCLSQVIGALRRRPDALAAYPDWHVIDAASKIINTIRLIDFDIDAMFTYGSVSIGPGACFRTSVRELIGYRNPLLRYSADLDYWYRLAIAGPIVHVPEPLATHRVHGESASISDKGRRLADETAYLFQAYCIHPLLRDSTRRLRTLAVAHGHFAAMFVATQLRQASRSLAAGLLAHPVGMLARCKDHSVDDVIRHFRSLGATRKTETDALFAVIVNCPTRREAAAPMIRAVLSDPIGSLENAKRYGLDKLIARIRALPVGRTVGNLHGREDRMRIANSAHRTSR